MKRELLKLGLVVEYVLFFPIAVCLILWWPVAYAKVLEVASLRVRDIYEPKL